MEESLERRAGFSRAREDLISKLPDSLITQILLYLPTNEAVRTCVLSKRWKSLWLSIPEVDLNSYKLPNYNAFVSFMDRFLEFSREKKLCLHKLKLSIRKSKSDQSCVRRWIDFVATRKIQHLDVECLLVERECFEVMPLSLYICETLLYLRLHRVFLGAFKSVSLPRLKTMHLELNVYDNDAGLESLISSCSVLEDLSIVRSVDVHDNIKVLRVHSQTLTRLCVEFGQGILCFDQRKFGLLIDAPRLKYLSFKHKLVEPGKIRSNFGSLLKVNFVGYFRISDGAGLSNPQMARNFFTSISRVRDLIISAHILELINYYLKVEPLPQFCNLYSLKAEVRLSSVPFLDMLPRLLESCPNLKSIVLCLLSSLEFVEINSSFMAKPSAMHLARYFARNSVILKKLVLRLELSMPEEESVALKYLLALPRQSRKCQIEVCGQLKCCSACEVFHASRRISHLRGSPCIAKRI